MRRAALAAALLLALMAALGLALVVADVLDRLRRSPSLTAHDGTTAGAARWARRFLRAEDDDRDWLGWRDTYCDRLEREHDLLLELRRA